MWTPLILLSICLAANCHVLPEESSPEMLDSNIVHYVKHFRQIISNYITTQYKTTIEHIDKVAAVLDDFFRKLATDLNDVLKNNEKKWDSKKKVEDGLPDEKFDEIKKNIQQQYPEITDDSANEIIYRLRINLYDTKLKLDEVMKKDEVVEPEQPQEETDS